MRLTNVAHLRLPPGRLHSYDVVIEATGLFEVQKKGLSISVRNKPTGVAAKTTRRKTAAKRGNP